MTTPLETRTGTNVLHPFTPLIRLARSAPWFAISLLSHVIVLASLTVLYFARAKAPEPEPASVLQLARVAPPVFETFEPPEQRIDRTAPLAKSEEDAGEWDETATLDEGIHGAPGEFIPEQEDTTREGGLENLDSEALTNLPSGMTGGTSVGVGNLGHYGISPSTLAGWRAGHGGTGGGGRGGDGTRRRGGLAPPKVTESTFAALQWLARHQSEDGRWDCDGFDAACKKNTCSGKGEATYDVGVTGLALLCFLGAGYTQQSGPLPYRRVVRDGVKFLVESQDEEGVFGGRSCQHYQYNHACAALAMAEAFGMTGAPTLRAPAQRGVAWILRSRNPYRAWRYDAADGDNDTSVTGWMTMALKSASMAGLDIEQSALADAASYVDDMTDGGGRTGYQQPGGLSARVQGPAMELFPAERSESLTAVGLVTRIFAGRVPESDPQIARGADLLLAKPPRWAGPDVDFYYWYYGTLAMHQVGGASWERWRKAMESELLAHQVLDEKRDEHGSWDPVDPWSAEGGRVYSTALNCLCTEVYYRYPRVFGAKAAAGNESKGAAAK